MWQYLVRRISTAIPLLFVISAILFLIMNSIGDPLLIQMSERAAPSGEELARIRRQMGLDQPIYLQYVYWLIGNDWKLIDQDGDGDTDENVYGQRKGVLRGDLGNSITTRQPVTTRMAERLPNTLILMIPMYILMMMLAVSLGILSAVRQYSLLDNVLTAVAYVFRAMPVFFISLGMIFIFSIWFRKIGLPYTPIAGMYGPGAEQTMGNLIRSMILPVMSMVLINTAGYMRYVRTSILEVMNQDYVRTARAKGLSERGVFTRHILKNASLPLVTLLGLNIPFVLAGAVVTESVFAWPGMGLLFIESVNNSDYPVLMGILMLIAFSVVVSQLLTDLTYSMIDPRIVLK
jgi:peptide/nickel transport system permease protein